MPYQSLLGYRMSCSDRRDCLVPVHWASPADIQPGTSGQFQVLIVNRLSAAVCKHRQHRRTQTHVRHKKSSRHASALRRHAIRLLAWANFLTNAMQKPCFRRRTCSMHLNSASVEPRNTTVIWRLPAVFEESNGPSWLHVLTFAM
jgi:hypothetical protein